MQLLGGIKVNLKKYLTNVYGKPIEKVYFDGDMGQIRSYYDWKSIQNTNTFHVDDITWNDLQMDEIFKSINQRSTTPGEQYLYYLLRNPALKQKDYQERLQLIENLEKDDKLRLKTQVILNRLGRNKNVYVYKMLDLSRSSRLRLIFYFGLVFAWISLLIGAIWHPWLVLISFAIIVFNVIFQEFEKRKIESCLDSVNYVVSLIKAARKLNRLAEIKCIFPNLGIHLEKLKFIRRIGFVPRLGDTMVEEFWLTIYIVNSMFLTNLIMYELVKDKIVHMYEDVMSIYDMIGTLDASISIASYRASLPDRCTVPRIDFDDNAPPFLDIQDMIHPLLKNPVNNNVKAARSALITGSNASGKSTYLKSILVNMIMAQSIGVVLAKSYKASSYKMFSSISVYDDLLGGDSYFVAELKSVKRIIDEIAVSGNRVFAVIDEVLCGTNTNERIAASSALLLALTQGNILCFSATHDMELCELLEDHYDMLHFNEIVSKSGKVTFDYKVKLGKAASSNAIKLLDVLGFDESLVSEANLRFDHYIQIGKWK